MNSSIPEDQFILGNSPSFNVGLFLSLPVALITLYEYAAVYRKGRPRLVVFNSVKSRKKTVYSCLYLLISLFLNSQALICMHPKVTHIPAVYIHALTVVLSLIIHSIFRSIYSQSKKVSSILRMLVFHVSVIFLTFYIQGNLIIHDFYPMFWLYECVVAFFASIAYFDTFCHKDFFDCLVKGLKAMRNNHNETFDTTLSIYNPNSTLLRICNEVIQKSCWKETLEEKIDLLKKIRGKKSQIRDLLIQKRCILEYRYELISNLRGEVTNESFNEELQEIYEEMPIIRLKTAALTRSIKQNTDMINELEYHLNE